MLTVAIGIPVRFRLKFFDGQINRSAVAQPFAALVGSAPEVISARTTGCGTVPSVTGSHVRLGALDVSTAVREVGTT